jgi:hypothetical protein
MFANIPQLRANGQERFPLVPDPLEDMAIPSTSLALKFTYLVVRWKAIL